MTSFTALRITTNQREIMFTRHLLSAVTLACATLAAPHAQAALEAGQAVKYTYVGNRLTEFFHGAYEPEDQYYLPIDLPGLTFSFVAQDYLAPGQTYFYEAAGTTKLEVTAGADTPVSSWNYFHCIGMSCWASANTDQYFWDMQEDYSSLYDRKASKSGPGVWHTEVISFESTGSEAIQFVFNQPLPSVPEANALLLAAGGLLMTWAISRRQSQRS